MDSHVILLLLLLLFECTADRNLATYSCLPGNGNGLMTIQFKLQIRDDAEAYKLALYSSGENGNLEPKENCPVLGSGGHQDPYHVEISLNYSRPITNRNGGKCGVTEVSSGKYQMRVRVQAVEVKDLKHDVFYEFTCDKSKLLNLATRIIPKPTDGHHYAYMKGIKPGVNLRLVDVNTRLPVTEVDSDSSVFLETVFYPPPSTNRHSTKGRNFWVGAMESGASSSSSTITLYILSASSFRSEVTLVFSNATLNSDITFIVDPGSYLAKTLELEPHQSTERTFTKSVNIKSTEEIYLMVSHMENNSESMFTVLPSDSLGTDYYLTPPYWYGTFLIIATNNSTKVSIDARGDLALPGGVLFDLSVKNITLDKFESIQGIAELGNFLHGTRILSDKPIAVFVGGKADDGKRQTDHTAEQVIHREMYGKRFVIPASSGSVHCVALQNSTELKHFGVREILQEQEYYVKVRNSYWSQFFVIVTNASVSCNIEYGNKHDAITMAPAVAQWSSAYTLYVNPDKEKYILKLAVKKGKEGSLKMYGTGDIVVSLSTIVWEDVIKTAPTEEDYVGGNFKISSRMYGPVIRIFHPSATFMAILVHDDSSNNILTAIVPPGFNLPLVNKNQGCHPSVGYSGDKIDNNCDGLIDDEESIDTVSVGYTDLQGTIYDKLDIIDVRPYLVLASVDGENTSHILIDENGCLSEFDKKGYLNPSSSFSTFKSNENYPFIYRTGTFKIPKINNSTIMTFSCKIQFCLDGSSSCYTKMCQPYQESINKYILGTEVEKMVLVKEKQDVMMPEKDSKEPLTASATSINRFIFLVTIAVLGLLLLTAIAVIVFLCMRIRFILASQKPNREDVQMNGLSNRYSANKSHYLDTQHQQWSEREMQNEGFQNTERCRENDGWYSGTQNRQWKDKQNEEFDYSFGEISSSVVI